MSLPETCNTFAVPMVRNIVGQGDRVEWLASGPLVPWQVHGAEDLWVSVDHTEELFRRFVEEGPQPELIANTHHQAGHLVVVSGEARVGKTTFVHRAVYHLTRRLHEVIENEAVAPSLAEERWTARSQHVSSHVHVVAIAGPENSQPRMGWADGSPGGVDFVNRRILDKIVKMLPEGIASEAGADLASHDIFRAYSALSAALVNLGQTLLVILPDFRWSDERLTRDFYRSCYDNAMTGIVFFAEVANSIIREDLRDELGDLSRSHAIHLPLGPLGDEDWIRFIEARRDHPDIPGWHVRVADEVLHADADNWVRQNIGMLQKNLYEVTRQAHQNRETEIGVAKFREYSRSHAIPDVRDFRRR